MILGLSKKWNNFCWNNFVSLTGTPSRLYLIHVLFYDDHRIKCLSFNVLYQLLKSLISGQLKMFKCIFVRFLFLFSLHTAINHTNLCPSCLHLYPYHSPSFPSPLGNSDSGKWDPWFEGETSACWRSAGLRRSSKWDKRMHTGEDGWTEWIDFQYLLKDDWRENGRILVHKWWKMC